MIRHTPSLLVSIIVHSLLLVAFFYTYSYVRSLPSDLQEEHICLKLQCISPEHKKSVKEKPKPKPKPELKPITPSVVKPKVIKPKKEKPKVEKIVKKIVPKPLSVPVVKEEIKPLEEPEEIYIEPIKEEVLSSEEFVNAPSQEEQAIAHEQEYMDENIKQIVRLLSDNLYYPRSARKRGVVGEVVVKFSLATDATVSSVEVVSSKSEILSRSAIKTIENLSGDFPKPQEKLTIHVPIKYELKR